MFVWMFVTVVANKRLDFNYFLLTDFGEKISIVIEITYPFQNFGRYIKSKENLEKVIVF